ncbi:sulfotransferase 16 [Tanacetum coccineum]
MSSGWNRNVRMALGAKLKLGFIDGSYPKPGAEDANLQRWIRYPDWYKGKKAKKQGRIAANVSLGFDDHFSADTPFDMGYENEIGINLGGGVDQRLVAAVCQEMMKMFKGKWGNNGISRDHASTSYAGILSCYTASFALLCHPYMNIKEDWIKDTGALDHMTPNFDLFITITHLKNPIIVHLPYGNSKIVIIVSKVQLTPSLILTNVLYVPKTLQLSKLLQLEKVQNDYRSANQPLTLFPLQPASLSSKLLI